MPIEHRRRRKSSPWCSPPSSTPGAAGPAHGSPARRPRAASTSSFAPALAEPFGPERRRAHRRRAQRPGPDAALRERPARVAGAAACCASASASARWSTCVTTQRRPRRLSRWRAMALRLARRRGPDALPRHRATPATSSSDALCRLVDPLIRARTDKQWEAIAAYRELGHQRDVASRAGGHPPERRRPPGGRPPAPGRRGRRGDRHLPGAGALRVLSAAAAGGRAVSRRQRRRRRSAQSPPSVEQLLDRVRQRLRDHRELLAAGARAARHVDDQRAPGRRR